MKTHKAVAVLLIVLWTIGAFDGFAQAQTTLSDEEKLERDFTDPLTTLPQVIVRDSYTPANYGPCTPQACIRDDETNQFLIRPVIPRIPPHTLLPFVQLVRPTFTLVTVPSSRGGTRTEFGDLPMFDIAVLPWPDRKKTGLLVGVGATFGVLALQDKSTLDQVCAPSKACPEASASDISSLTRDGTISTVGFGVAVAGAATGFLLWILTRPSGPSDAPRPVAFGPGFMAGSF